MSLRSDWDDVFRECKRQGFKVEYTSGNQVKHVAKHGPQSWEVDAIPPVELQRLIRNALAALVDDDLMDAIKEKEETQKKLLRKAAAKI